MLSGVPSSCSLLSSLTTLDQQFGRFSYACLPNRRHLVLSYLTGSWLKDMLMLVLVIFSTCRSMCLKWLHDQNLPPCQPMPLTTAHETVYYRKDSLRNKSEKLIYQSMFILTPLASKTKYLVHRG